MEFNFNINNFFKDEITKIGPRLIPDGFIGDRREVQDCLSKISYILTILGEKSAKAQGLQKVITSGEKLRNSEHVVYVLVDPKGGSKGFGTVLGMLKMGVKHLYVFDAGGKTHEVTTKCILDFYVHESKQRMGLGKKLFEYMLQEERVDPVHLAIDKPSSKFLSFLVKHYGLEKVIPQMNNFVVFEGFFSNRQCGEAKGSEEKQKVIPAGVSSCGNRFTSESGGYISTPSPKPNHYQSASTVNINNVSYYGRQAPHKPITTMGLILQHKPSPSQQQPQNASIRPKKLEISSPITGLRSNGERKTNVSSLEEDVVNNSEKDIPVSPPTVAETENENEAKIVESNLIAEENTEELKIDEEKKEEVEEEEKKDEQEKTDTKVNVSPSDSFTKPVINSLEIPINQKRRVNSQGHLDLKFYHSSLW